MLRKLDENPLISVIIPVYNEEKYIEECIQTIINQTYSNFEIIVVDDGSIDNSSKIISKYNSVTLVKQQHRGPGSAKNLGAKCSKGKILVFIDGDMYLHKNYLREIINPLLNGNYIATYTTSEYVSNINNIWAKCWNINIGLPYNYPAPRINFKDEFLGLAFRAILKKKFISYGGFDSKLGYIDDRSINKIKNRIIAVDNAVCYHFNPDNLIDVFLSARWIGRSVTFVCNFNNLLKYSIVNSLRIAIRKIVYGAPIRFLIFKIVFDLGLLIGMINNNISNNRSK